MASKSKESLFKRLTRLFRGGPIVRRKIRSLDTVVAGPDKMSSSGVALFQKSTSPTYANITANAYNLSERLMRYQDFQEMEYSVHGGQLIATPESPDGFKKIEDLAAECLASPGKTFIVYSYDHEKKQIVPALAHAARQTCVDHAWRIKFDNDKEVIASAEHRLMLRDGTYRKVEDLQLGDAMMPFYRKDLFENATEGTNGYRWIYTMDKKFRGWTKEHQLIAEWAVERELLDGEVVHHINFVKTDNRPENLRIMTESDHNSYHASLNNDVKWAPENQEWIEKFKKNHAIWMRDNAPTRRRDVTFARIVEVCERVGFSISRACSALDISEQLLNERLVAHGFKSFSVFAEAYKYGSVVPDQLGRPGVMTRDLSLELIKSLVAPNDTKRSLAIKLNCTVNVLDKFLSRRVNLSWSQLREQLGYSLTDETDDARNHRKGGRKKGTWASRSEVTFKQICDAFEPGLTLPRLASKISANKNTVISRLAQSGYKKYSDFASQYENCKVVSIEYVGVIPLYDLTVDGYKNFATDSVISHNTPELAAALDIYADEVMAQDEKGRVLHVYSDNPKIKTILDDLFYNILNMEFNGRSWVRNLVKYGDFFLYNDVSPEYGVVNAFPIPINEIEREEGFDRDDPFAVRFRWLTLGNRVLENWEVTHMRLLGNDMFLPYGSSVIEPARRIWRQLILIEDAMMVYRVVRAPERRVFYIDVGNIPPEDVPMYIEEQRKNLRTQSVTENSTGRIDLRYNPLSVDEDYFIAVRGADTGTKIDTLAGGQNTAAVEDVEYIQKKLFAAIKIPRAYLGYEDMLGSKATLAQEDIRFSRTINVIQKTVIAELNKLAVIHLFAHGFDGDDLVNFTLRLSNPSTIAQQQKLELWRAKFDIAGSMPEGMLTKEFVQQEIFGLNSEQIKQLEERRLYEAAIDAAIEAGGGEAAGGGGGGGGGGGDLFGGGGGGAAAPDVGGGEDMGADLGGGEEPAAEEPDAGGDEEDLGDELEAGEEPVEDDGDQVELLLASEIEGSSPVNVSRHSKNAHRQYTKDRQQSYRKSHGSGEESSVVPNFNAMTAATTTASHTKAGAKKRSTEKDIFAADDFRQVASGKFESLRRPASENERAMELSGDMVSMLARMAERFGMFRGETNVLSESVDAELEGSVFIGNDDDDAGEDK